MPRYSPLPLVGEGAGERAASTSHAALTIIFALLTLGFSTAYAQSDHPPDLPIVILPKASLGPEELAVIVNDADPLSIRIAEYYRAARSIPDKNIIHVSFSADSNEMKPEAFAKIRAIANAKTPARIQAYALTWIKPYRVGCMSITTAFAAGFDQKYCASGCNPTYPSRYFNTYSKQPFKDFGLRPTMAITAETFEQAKELIDRGIKSDGSLPQSVGYLMETSDKARDVRAALYPEIMQTLGKDVRLERVRADSLVGKSDVLFYFTGLAKVDHLNTLHFLPGAIADHLTSKGGQLTGSDQMSSLRWIEAGATASYGAVAEPCNILPKFPHPGIVMDRYLSGETLIEAYWKSVAMPGQGIFIGEPLAKPYGGYQLTRTEDALILRSRSIPPGRYAILGAISGVGPYMPVKRGIIVGDGWQELRLANDPAIRYYMVVPERRR